MELKLAADVVIAERFRLTKEIGQGGMGSVWAATHLITNKVVALKFMHSATAEMTARFVREAQSASAVRHPNVVDIHDVLKLPDGTPLMVMEMLTGETLAERLTREGGLSPPDCAQIMLPVISAISAAHAAGIVHRDLKPENIFLTRYAQTIVPKVLDFGIAKVVASAGANDAALTRTGSVLGTPYYMSPEQVFGEKDVDARSDIWALGVILYQCLSGKRPFDGDNFGQLLKAVTLGMFQPLEVAAPWVPPHLSYVVGGMLRERSARVSDLGEVERALMSVFPMAPTSMPMMSSSQGQLPLAQSGGYRVQSSGGFPMMPSSGGFPAAAPSAMTPNPMVRSQTVALSSSRNDQLPMQGKGSGKIVIGVVAGLVVVAVAIFGASRFRSNATAKPNDPIGIVQAPLTTTADTSTSATIPTTTTTAAVASTQPVDHTATPQHTTTTPMTTALVTATATPSASATASAQHAGHTGGTGGLSTSVPF